MLFSSGLALRYHQYTYVEEVCHKWACAVGDPEKWGEIKDRCKKPVGFFLKDAEKNQIFSEDLLYHVWRHPRVKQEVQILLQVKILTQTLTWSCYQHLHFITCKHTCHHRAINFHAQKLLKAQHQLLKYVYNYSRINTYWISGISTYWIILYAFK